MTASLQELIDDPALRTGTSVCELVDPLLQRIERTHAQLNVFITVADDLARRDAAASDLRRERGTRLGPLDGLPIAVKDNIDVARMHTTRGSAFFADRVPHEDAEVIRRLRAAGAIVLGKVNLHEFAYGATNDNPHYGTCRNPWDPERVPGGSSGGSGAAVGADLCLGALGSDTGGSVRIPAALNGVSALRPTYGMVSTRGTFPVSASFDTVGPMARSIADVAELLSVMAGYDREDPHAVEYAVEDPVTRLAEGVAGLRVGLPTSFFFDDLDPAIAARAYAAAEQLGALGADVVELDVKGAAEATATATLIIRAEATGLHEARMDTQPDRFGADVLRRLELGRTISGVQVAQALGQLRAWRVQARKLFDEVDLILTPTTNAVAPRILDADMIEVTAQLTRFTYAWSLAGMPAVSVPAGFDDTGMPIGVQLAAAPWRDALALRAGYAFQQATDHHRRRPPAFPSD